jgi:peptide/nickel transport system substrate-binding protein
MVAGRYSEAPMLAAKVTAGELPAVEERLPVEPKVVPPVESIGKYGGTLTIFAVSELPISDFLEPRHGSNLFRVPRNGIGIEPDLAADFEMSREEKSFTIFLREGLKWSDGTPLTSEDVRFVFEDMHMHPNVRTWGGLGVTAVDVIDELTVKLIKGGGLGILNLQLADWFGSDITSMQPAHYLKKWHIDYNDDAQTLAEEEGFDNWYDAMNSHYWWWPFKDPELPRLDPWVLKEFGTTQRVYERNPYFWRVDPEGNQLPYLDGFVSVIVDPEVNQLKISGGAADLSFVNTQLDNISLYKTNAERGGYDVTLYPGTMSTAFTLIPVLTQKDPVMRELAMDVRFRQALSVAINRDEMNEILAFGLGTPGAASPLPSASFYMEGWREHFAQYDPDLANKLLDEIGLAERDNDGFRKRPDGETLTLLLEYFGARLTPAFELITEYYADVGVKSIMKIEDPGLMNERRNAGEFFAWMHNAIWYPWSSERFAFMNAWVWSDEGGHAPPWGTWLGQKLTAVQEMLGEGVDVPPNWRWLDTPKDGELAGERPPDWWIEQADLEDEWLLTEMGSPEYVELGQKVYDFYVKNVFKIGTVGEIPKVLVAKKGLGNIPPPGYITGIDLGPRLMQTYQDQLYWK